MTKQAKATNYTAEQVATMASMYTGADNKSEVAAIAAELGKTVNSVRAKLSNEGLYVKAESVKTGKGDRTTKATVAAEIGALAGLNEVEQEALTKTTGAVLDKLLAKLTN